MRRACYFAVQPPETVTYTPRGLGCARCGDCCDPVHTSWDLDDLHARAEAWVRWLLHVPEEHWDRDMRADRADWRDFAAATLTNYDFVRRHWTRLSDSPGGMRRWSCDAFDPTSRQCVAHADRPPVCSMYPWYGEPPSARAIEALPHCSYQGDLPPDSRPPQSRPLIPIEAL